MVSAYFNQGGTNFFVFPFIRHLLVWVDTLCNNHNRKETDESNRRWQSRTSNYFMDEVEIIDRTRLVVKNALDDRPSAMGPPSPMVGKTAIGEGEVSSTLWWTRMSPEI